MTADGQELLICQMGDQHLTNMIKFLARRIKEAQQVLTEQVKPDPMIEVLSPGYSHKAVQDRARRQLKEAHDQIGSYVLETALRGLDVSAILQEAYGRSSSVPSSNLMLKAMENTGLLDDQDY